MEHSYFREALARFTHEAASGGAIRHLADTGYTVRQITDKLDFPTPYTKVQATVWEHLIQTRVIVLEISGGVAPTPTYVREYDQYGKASFRRVVEEGTEAGSIAWSEHRVEDGDGEQLSSLLGDKMQENGEGSAYMSCDFGLIMYREPQKYQKMLQVLRGPQREYLDGLPWERRRVYHKLDHRMREILLELYCAGFYRGECYFLKTGQKLLVL